MRGWICDWEPRPTGPTAEHVTEITGEAPPRITATWGQNRAPEAEQICSSVSRAAGAFPFQTYGARSVCRFTPSIDSLVIE